MLNMKVRELREKLDECDPEDFVFFENCECEPYDCSMIRKSQFGIILTLEPLGLSEDEQFQGA